MSDSRAPRIRSLSPEELAEVLKTRLKALQDRHQFQVGDVVTWKDGMKNKRRPYEGEPAIVVELLPKPVFDDEQGSGSAYFREPLDIVLGFLDDDGDFIVIYLDSRRLEAFGAH